MVQNFKKIGSGISPNQTPSCGVPEYETQKKSFKNNKNKLES
jgi:hypothetical protein